MSVEDALKKLDSLEERTREVEVAIVKIETELKHTLKNKHAEAIATAKAIDAKVRWVSFIIGGVATFGTIISTYLALSTK